MNNAQLHFIAQRVHEHAAQQQRERIEQQRAHIAAIREQFRREAEQQLAFFNGQIDALDALLQPTPAPEPAPESAA